MLPTTYKIISFLGVGHSASVYKAMDEEGRTVALKVYHTNIDNISEAGLNIMTERSLIGHNYKHLVKVYKGAQTYIKGELRTYLEMEYIEGDTLRGLMNDGCQSERLIGKVLPKLQKAIKELRKQGIIYCDLKPENIMVTKNGTVKFIDLQHIKTNSNCPITEGEKKGIERSIRLPWFLKTKMLYQDELFWKAYSHYYLVELLNDTVVRSNRFNSKTFFLYLKTQFSFIINFIDDIEESIFYIIIAGTLVTNFSKIFKRRKRFQTFFFDDSVYLAY